MFFDQSVEPEPASFDQARLPLVKLMLEDDPALRKWDRVPAACPYFDLTLPLVLVAEGVAAERTKTTQHLSHNHRTIPR